MNTVRLALGLAFAFICTSPLNGAVAMDSAYIKALRAGDTGLLREALNQGAPANARDGGGNTPLMHAAVYGNTACLRLLLDRGADINATNAAGATALMRAAYDYDKVRLLVERGASVNARSGFGNTALLLASRPARSHRVVEFLLAKGADPKLKNNFGGTALMAAAAGGDAKTLQILIKAGVEVDAQPTPDEMGFLLGGGRSALMWAAFRGDVAMVKALLDAGANVNAIGGLGTALSQAAWANKTDAAQLLVERGARVGQTGPRDDFTPLHWAASSEEGDASLVKLLLEHGADPNLGGGDVVDAFVSTPQTPLMLARRRGESSVLAALSAAGATNATPEKLTRVNPPPQREIPALLDKATVRDAIAQALPPLQKTSIRSKQSYVRDEQDCTSCHQQYLPMAAVGFAKSHDVPVDKEAEQQLIEMVRGGEMKGHESDWQALFHPEAPHTKGYEVLAYAAEQLPADESSDAWVYHLAAIQGPDGRWHNNLPRPPMQTSDIGATALAVHALKRYPLPGRKNEFARRIEHAREWLWDARPKNTEGRIYQLLGLSWAGESPRKLKQLAIALMAEQRSDGGWAQLPGLKSDAYATGQAVFALRLAAISPASRAAADEGARWLIGNQLADGTWHVRRRAFPFQPTMNSGFPHGRDSWISAAATSWGVMALSAGKFPSADELAVSKLSKK